MSPWYWHQYTGYYASCIHLLYWTLSFHILVSPLHRYCYTGRLLFHVHVPLTHWPLLQHVPGHYCFMCCITITWSQFLHVLVLALHGYSGTRDTVLTCGYLLYWMLLLHVIVDFYTDPICIDIIILFIFTVI